MAAGNFTLAGGLLLVVIVIASDLVNDLADESVHRV